MRESIDQSEWQIAYLREIESYKQILTNKKIKSIFFGGGTPSLADPFLIESVIKRLQPDNDTEITLEANPTSVEADKFRDYALAGINRVSIGVQSLNAGHLQFLGREHTAGEALKAIELAGKYFNRYSFDLMYMLPNQTLVQWQKELEYALPLTKGHLSLYQLTIERGTRFFSQHRRHEFIMPDEEIAAEAYEYTNSAMEGFGLPYYEVSNYAAPGHECQHNLTYWRYQDYIGIGPGAHGRYSDASGSRYATINKYAPEEWLFAVTETGSGKRSDVLLTDSEVYEERILMGIRLREGMNLSYFKNVKKINELALQGFLEITNKKVRATSKGLLLLNSVIKNIIV